ncbi:MAG: excinuclease ABC subunit UvrC [Bacteroidetes bacterium]|nr:excinuclease ABC subunit UvrC [Bacteroidota bacterium]MBU1115471.1 excinuclease ABC subunit UvrC [Bacteroidota bacterium]MBU1800084.1 excinuclease ABC subunit UvrC [Bacteroidota bacterium]
MTKIKSEQNTELQAKLDSLPTLPGIYQFKDKTDKVIYVGKAKNLRNRVRSYFRSTVDSPKTMALVNKIIDFQLIVTDSEVEALVLENNLIKELKPKYNISLKDDKTFPYIRVTNEPYPQVFPTRNVVRDGSKYFGPYTNVKDMKSSLRMINQTFKIRSCKHFIDSDSIAKGKIKICLDYHIKKCDGPCEGFVSQDDYIKMVSNLIKVLKGKSDILIKELYYEMKIASDNYQFEKAAEIRDTIKKLEVYSSKQKIVSTDFGDRDVISVAVEGKDVASTILIIREGRLVGRKQLTLTSNLDENLSQVYSSVIKLYYTEFVEVPKEIIIEVLPFEHELILDWLKIKAERNVKFVVPQIKSDAMSLIKMCKQNSILQLKDIQLQKMKKEGNLPYVLQALKRDLRLNVLPRKIECFDISHIQGSETVASLVVFVDGKPKKSLYRRFIIIDVEGVDDFASMREVVERRYTILKNENEPLPELIMVDGGKGQLSSAVSILDNLGYANYNIIGLAKRLEEIFFPGDSEPQTIPKTSSSLKLLQHLRDEAHRFAITFHRERRSKRTFQTELTEIDGIGETIASKLLIEFKSVSEIRNKSLEELSNFIGASKGKLVFDYFNEKRED